MGRIVEPVKKRAIRRHHKKRMKRRAAKKLRQWDMEPTEDRVGRMHDNMAVCSCWGCGNQRRMDGDTIQERKHEMDMVYGIDEWEAMGRMAEEESYKEDLEYANVVKRRVTK